MVAATHWPAFTPFPHCHVICGWNAGAPSSKQGEGQHDLWHDSRGVSVDGEQDAGRTQVGLLETPPGPGVVAGCPRGRQPASSLVQMSGGLWGKAVPCQASFRLPPCRDCAVTVEGKGHGYADIFLLAFVTLQGGQLTSDLSAG